MTLNRYKVFLLKLTVNIQNGRLHVKPHDQILYVDDSTLCSRY